MGKTGFFRATSTAQAVSFLKEYGEKAISTYKVEYTEGDGPGKPIQAPGRHHLHRD